jgi:hypothetical protein
MASTNTLNRTMNLSQAYVRNAPLIGVYGYVNEPTFSIGDWVRQFILGPPFAWRWNRLKYSFTTVAGQQDYPVSLSQFGWLEIATVNDGLNTSTSIHQLEIQNPLGEESAQMLPTKMAVQFDDDKSNITFRLYPAPDQAYTVTIHYQKASPTFQTIQDTWAPIPDYMYYAIQQGFLARTYEYMDDARYLPTFQLFMRQIVAAAEGLTEAEKSIFLEERISSLRQQQASAQNGQLGRQARVGA